MIAVLIFMPNYEYSNMTLHEIESDDYTEDDFFI